MKIKHITKQLYKDTCLIIFGASSLYDEQNPPEIIRIFQDGRGMKFQSGSIIGRQDCKAALAITVRHGDLIRIQEYGKSNQYMQSVYFKVGIDSALIRLSKNTNFGDNRILRALLADSRRGAVRQLWDDEDLTVQVFGSACPVWLKDAIIGYMEWKDDDNPEAWWRVTPRSISRDGVVRVVAESPDIARLLYWNRLDIKALHKCIYGEFSRKIKWASYSLTQCEIEHAVMHYSDYVLKYATRPLTDTQLRLCVSQNSHVAMEYRYKYTSHKRAVVLSLAIKTHRDTIDEILDDKFKLEIKESLQQNLDVWMETFENCYQRLYRNLKAALKITNKRAYLEIREMLPVVKRKELDRFVASRI